MTEKKPEMLVIQVIAQPKWAQVPLPIGKSVLVAKKKSPESINLVAHSSIALYLAAGSSLRVRRVALGGIPGAARKHSEGGAWSTQPT